MHTSHWGQIGSAAILVGNSAASAVCGHSIDLTSIDWVGLILTQGISWADWINRHRNPQTIMPSPTPSS
jgi:hypothetical protein